MSCSERGWFFDTFTACFILPYPRPDENGSKYSHKKKNRQKCYENIAVCDQPAPGTDEGIREEQPEAWDALVQLIAAPVKA